MDVSELGEWLDLNNYWKWNAIAFFVIAICALLLVQHMNYKAGDLCKDLCVEKYGYENYVYVTGGGCVCKPRQNFNLVFNFTDGNSSKKVDLPPINLSD